MKQKIKLDPLLKQGIDNRIKSLNDLLENGIDDFLKQQILELDTKWIQKITKHEGYNPIPYLNYYFQRIRK